jgi:hypothetical protein
MTRFLQLEKQLKKVQQSVLGRRQRRLHFVVVAFRQRVAEDCILISKAFDEEDA